MKKKYILAQDSFLLFKVNILGGDFFFDDPRSP